MRTIVFSCELLYFIYVHLLHPGVLRGGNVRRPCMETIKKHKIKKKRQQISLFRVKGCRAVNY